MCKTLGAVLLDIIVILALIAALAAVVVFQNALLALAVIAVAMAAAYLARKRPSAAHAARATGKGVKSSWTASCPKCKNTIKSKEVECGNCKAHEIKVVGGKRPRLKCGHCESPANDPACPKCETIIAAKFWR